MSHQRSKIEIAIAASDQRQETTNSWQPAQLGRAETPLFDAKRNLTSSQYAEKINF